MIEGLLFVIWLMVMFFLVVPMIVPEATVHSFKEAIRLAFDNPVVFAKAVLISMILAFVATIMMSLMWKGALGR